MNWYYYFSNVDHEDKDDIRGAWKVIFKVSKLQLKRLDIN